MSMADDEAEDEDDFDLDLEDELLGFRFRV